MPGHTIKDQFIHDDGQRQGILERVELAAALTKPQLMPPSDQLPNDKLPEKFIDVGSRGLANLEGRMLLALWPPGTPWFQLLPEAQIRFDDSVDDQTLRLLERQLFLQELIILARLEGSKLDLNAGRRRPGTFRSRKRQVISQILGTGDVLEQMMPDYRIKHFGRRAYVTKRDSEGDVLYHIVKEHIDPLALSDEVFLKTGLDKTEVADKSVTDRMVDIFTHPQWNPQTKKWVIRQEVNDNEVAISEEPITPFFATTYELAPEEDYGRGFIELLLGGLGSSNALTEYILDFAATASKNLIFLGYNSRIRPTDFEKPSGSIVRGDVSSGAVQDAAMWKADRLSDFSVVERVLQRVVDSLSKAMLLESELQPTGDRVTAFQVRRIALELEGALGGIYASVADEQQTPLLKRTIWQMRADNSLLTWPDDSVDVQLLTGIAALTRELELSKIQLAVQDVAALGEAAFRKIDMGVLVELIFKMRAVEQTGLIKSDEQIRQEIQQELQAMAEAEAAKKAIDTIGNVAEAQATEAATGAAPTGA